MGVRVEEGEPRGRYQVFGFAESGVNFINSHLRCYCRFCGSEVLGWQSVDYLQDPFGAGG